MNPLELLASHTSFKGEQRLYRHYADSLHRPLEVAIYLPVASLLKERLVRRASGRTTAAAMDRPRHGRRPPRQQNPPRRL